MITLKPTFRYWLMTNLVWLVILSLLFLAVSFWELPFYVRLLSGCLCMVIVFGIFWNYLVLYKITYIIETEQIIIKHGVFHRVTDYLEMYRMYDYQKKQTIFEVAFGLMNVVLITRDSGHPHVVFRGITNNDDVIPVIRDRVETEKQRKRIVEFNNLMIS
jgi:uncharacterized membrane protein YdbT with pleckstrin-like domain